MIDPGRARHTYEGNEEAERKWQIFEDVLPSPMASRQGDMRRKASYSTAKPHTYILSSFISKMSNVPNRWVLLPHKFAIEREVIYTLFEYLFISYLLSKS